MGTAQLAKTLLKSLLGRCSPESSEKRASFDLDLAVGHNDSAISVDATGVAVSTPVEQWAYALEIPKSETAPRGPVTVTVEIDCPNGAVGIGLLGNDESRFVAEAQAVGISQTVSLPASDLADVKCLMLRNVSARGPSTAKVRSVAITPGVSDEVPEIRVDDAGVKQLGTWRGAVPAGFFADWSGVLTRADVYAFNDEYLAAFAKEREESHWIATTNTEIMDWVPLADSVARSNETFRMAALGAGWGRWVSAGAFLSKRRGIDYRVIAVEAEPQHYAWLERHMQENGLSDERAQLVHAAVSGNPGFCWFQVGNSAAHYGQSIVSFGPEQPSGDVQRVPMITLADVLERLSPLDYIHMDVQGAELDLLSAYPELLDAHVKCVNVGTHSAEIDAGLRRLFNDLGWTCLYDIPIGARRKLTIGEATTAIQFEDGVQVWLNPKSVSIVHAAPPTVASPRASEAPVLPGTSFLGSVIMNAYAREILGKKTYGRVLNIGAGNQSVTYRFDHRLTNTEYHTLDVTSENQPTYVGDARNMPMVPSESYDWVLAIAVLEHVNDMHAVVREITRVLKPGGGAYISVPFHNELHFTRGYGDYWRVSPFGFHELLDDSFSFEEVEYWGDCVIDPFAVAVLARKSKELCKTTSRLYQVEGGLDTVHRLIDGEAILRLSIPIWRLKEDGIDYCLRVQDYRATVFAQTGNSLTFRDADKQLFRKHAELEGTLVISNEESRLILRAGGSAIVLAEETIVGSNAVALNSAIIHNASTVEGKDVLTIYTPSAQWAYAVEFPLQDQIPSQAHPRLKIRVSGRVIRGVIGLGCRSADGNFLREAQLMPSDDIEDVDIAIGPDESCTSIVVRNCSSEDASVIELAKISVCEFADDSTLISDLNLDEDELRNYLKRSPGGTR